MSGNHDDDLRVILATLDRKARDDVRSPLTVISLLAADEAATTSVAS
jgi:hypothetical protein